MISLQNSTSKKMDFFALSDVKHEFHKLKEKSIILMDYECNFAAFVTTDNLLFHCSVDEWTFFEDKLNYELTEINNFNYGKIQTLMCGDGHIFIVNEDDIIYKITCEGDSSYYKDIEYSEINLKEFENDKIKFIRTKVKESIYHKSKKNIITNIFSGCDYIFVTNNNLYFIDKSLQLTQRKMKLNVCIKDLQCGISHMVLLDNNGFIYGMGCGKYFGLQNEEMSENFLLINLSFKVIKIICDKRYTIILNEYNELFGVGKNEFGELGLGHTQPITVFTKIVINCAGKIQNIIRDKSVSNRCILISSYTDDIYIVGHDESMENIFTKENLKFGSFYNRNYYYLDTFTKVEIPKSTKKFMYPFLIDGKLFILRTDYIINKEDEENILGEKCFKVLQNEQLVDLVICCNDYSIKKRKRNEFNE